VKVIPKIRRISAGRGISRGIRPALRGFVSGHGFPAVPKETKKDRLQPPCSHAALPRVFGVEWD